MAAQDLHRMVLLQHVLLVAAIMGWAAPSSVNGYVLPAQSTPTSKASQSPVRLVLDTALTDHSHSSNACTRLSATVERAQDSEFSSFSSDDGSSDEEKSIKIASLEKSLQASSIPAARNTSKARTTSFKKKHPLRKKNAAMHDPQFLRKRTADLLKVTECDAFPDHHAPLGKHMKVDKKTFHFLLDAWAFSSELDAADQAAQLLQRMEDLAHVNANLSPDVRSYTKTINAIARQANLNAGEQAQAILLRLQSAYNEALINNPEAAAMLKPNSFTYTALVQAHANSGAPGSAERAQALTEQMVESSFASRAGDDDDSVRPTAKAFNAVIHAYGKVGMAQQAQAFFDKMEQLYQTGGIPEAKPNAFNYNALISAWANCDSVGSEVQAMAVLERMESLYYATGNVDVKPTTISFNAVLDAHAKSGQDDAAPRAQELLTHMTNLYEQNKDDAYAGAAAAARPNTRSFNSVINAWAKSGHEDAAYNAQELLDLMEKRYEAGDASVRPDVHSFCTVINAIARSSMPNKAERAYNLYNDMEKLYKAGNKHVRPNVVAANAAMNACAFTVGDTQKQNQAVEIAHSILKKLEHSPYGNPDQVTYGTFLKVCANQMPDSHTTQQITEVLFKKCKQDGQVGELVLQQLRSMASDELYQQLVGRGIHEFVRMEDLPKEWWCNVVEGKWRRKRNSL